MLGGDDPSEIDVLDVLALAQPIKSVSCCGRAGVLAEDTGGSMGRMYIVLAGTARAEVDGHTVADYTAGDHFGEISLLAGGPGSATVTTTSVVVAIHC